MPGLLPERRSHLSQDHCSWTTMYDLAPEQLAVTTLTDGHMLVVPQTCSGWHCESYTDRYFR